ncbi:hypothetical protein [Streptomyces sp. NBC_01214]|uniref:hypothetical protein n=1 Tax=Streptomyces sp. NBC_01214 TaxID=2903777 RepID=UPI002B1D7374|nr:hypothetical protein [Streptomyces sp. NBC_01214]
MAVHGAHRHIAIVDVEGRRLIPVEGDVHVGRLGVPAEISTARGGIIIGEAVRGTVVLRTQHGDISSPPPGTGASATP